MPKKASCSAVSISVLILVIEVWTIDENVLKRYTFLYDNAFNALMGACKNKLTIVWAKLFCFLFVETKKYTVKNVGSISTALSSPVPEGPPSEEFGGEGVGKRGLISLTGRYSSLLFSAHHVGKLSLDARF